MTPAAEIKPSPVAAINLALFVPAFITSIALSAGFDKTFPAKLTDFVATFPTTFPAAPPINIDPARFPPNRSNVAAPLSSLQSDA